MPCRTPEVGYPQTVVLVVPAGVSHWTVADREAHSSAQQCGWLKDKYGVSWQIVPSVLADLMSDADPRKSERTMIALLPMKKLDIATLQRAHDAA